MSTRSRLTRIFWMIPTLTLILSACAPAAMQAPTSQTVEVEGGKQIEQPITVAPLEPLGRDEEPVAGAEPLQPHAATESPVLPEMPAMTEAPVLEYQYSPLPTAAPTMSPWLPITTPPVDNYFKDYGINPFEDPREDHLSTFALDVDTASYSVARRYVTEGLLPPIEAVRVEEFVNYFNAGYPTPQDIAFAVYADGAPSPYHTDGSQILRFGIQGYQVREEERKTASLTFVIDVSGSMDMENRLGLVKQSLELLVERLRPSDSVSIVVYGSTAHVILNPTSGEDKNYILNAIYSLRPEGATNAEAGLNLGYQLAYQAYRPGGINRVILCSDGVANVGETSPEAILRSIRTYADQGITLTTVGFGMGNFNDVLMEQLADNGDGSYAYIDTLDEARKLFVEDLTSTLQTIARDAKAQVDFNPSVVARYRLIGYENRDVADQDFRNDAVDAGEIGAGHSVTALYAVILQPGAQGRIATVHLRWEDPQSFTVREINGDFNTWDLSPTFENASPRYQLAVTVSQYAELLRLSPWARGSSIGQVLQHAVRLSGLLPQDDEVSEFATLVSRASQIQELISWR